MREYVYIWNNPNKNYIIASGIEFKDIANIDKNYLLLSHESEIAEYDLNTRFDYIRSNKIDGLLKEDIYSFGNFSWVPYTGETFPILSKKTVAELLYFNHITEPFDKIIFEELLNEYLAFAHDDGWFLKMYYDNFQFINKILEKINKKFSCYINTSEFQKGLYAYWIDKNGIETEIISDDIDKILNKRKWKHKAI
ncbi:hypothetical protein E4O03_04720 [Treponema sp. OMZ 792]|uniref:hypothetical protein n=1 Tax=unclassified Treponema TaxID=2638727 RepID=UPI0020A55CA4|nr:MULTISPECIES: hypothetical protein [unclassified Treponema]UTC76015.1 hypothetical protein E4O03_04720 [Treponema sp. OMZ 792]UTC80017.1 hypothetical protein E4O07_04740 [Treponema sp. OMZ 798]